MSNTNDEYNKFNDFVQKNNTNFYQIIIKDKMLKNCLKGISDYEDLSDFLKTINKYLPNIIHSGINLKVDIDNEKYIINLTI